ncbi:MAG: hypothetical protein GF308_16995 [Candidatus Heimdallarchaeota archaeon]|nr:hypothetical protein [Candidatus Heimdallarchaeota archaeon]
MTNKMMNILFNQRFILGIYAPILLEFIVYAIYAVARGIGLTIAIFLWALILFAPALFLYMISPIIIFNITGVSRYHKKNLEANIDSLFIFPDDQAALEEPQRQKVRKAIEEQLIPQLLERVRGLYIDSYISRSIQSRRDKLLTSFETLFLFSSTWGLLSVINLFGVVVLHFTPIRLDFVVLDQITNPVNVTLFAIVFFLFAFISDFIAIYSISRLRDLILESLPVVIYIDEEEKIRRDNFIRSINNFPIKRLIDDHTLRRHSRRIDPIFQKQYAEPLAEAIQFYARNQVAKQQAWRIYKPILDELKVSAEQAAVIKDRFFKTPIYEIAREVFAYDHELKSLKTDLEYVKNRLNLWEKTSAEERTTALLFLFRASEQLFKSILDHFDVPIEAYSNFSMILNTLEDKGIITDEEKEAIDVVRKKRNTLVHQSGRIVPLEKEELEAFLSSLEQILLNVEGMFQGKEK